MKRSRRHHIVPEAMQKAFLGADDKLWYTERNPDGHFVEPEDRTPKGAFWKPHHNTIIVDGAPSDIIEREYYGALDDFIGRVFPALISILEKGKAPRMDQKLEDKIKKAVYQLLLRSPDFVDFDDEEIGKEFLESLNNAYQLVDETEERLEAVRADLRTPSKVRAFGRNIRTRSMFQMPERSLEEIFKYSIRWSIAPQRCSYILSGRIVMRTANGGLNGVGNPDTELWMPISPKFCLVLVRDRDNNIPIRVLDSRDRLREFNEYACANSWAFASHSRKLVRSLAKL